MPVMIIILLERRSTRNVELSKIGVWGVIEPPCIKEDVGGPMIKLFTAKSDCPGLFWRVFRASFAAQLTQFAHNDIDTNILSQSFQLSNSSASSDSEKTPRCSASVLPYLIFSRWSLSCSLAYMNPRWVFQSASESDKEDSFPCMQQILYLPVFLAVLSSIIHPFFRAPHSFL